MTIARDDKGRFAPTIRGQKNRLHIRFTDECFSQVRNLAADNGYSIAAQVEDLVKTGLRNNSEILPSRIILTVSSLLIGFLTGSSLLLLTL